jgi:hypothetical protein
MEKTCTVDRQVEDYFQKQRYRSPEFATIFSKFAEQRTQAAPGW